MKRIASFLSSLSIQRITAPCLCLMLVLICLFSFQKQLTPTSGIVSSRKLPILCVNTESPKVAFSFDAAWVDACLCQKDRCRIPSQRALIQKIVDEFKKA